MHFSALWYVFKDTFYCFVGLLHFNNDVDGIAAIYLPTIQFMIQSQCIYFERLENLLAQLPRVQRPPKKILVLYALYNEHIDSPRIPAISL